MKILLTFLSLLLIMPNAQSQLGSGHKKHNDQLPIEITADSLEVLQKGKKAIFTGTVEATQGNLKLNSDEMLVYYKSKVNRFGKTQNSVSKVETQGNVRLSTPNETAKSNIGVFNIERNTITLSGNVTLTSGKSIVKGEKLVYNLTTGQSKMIKGSNNGTTKNNTRVRGVFAPNN